MKSRALWLGLFAPAVIAVVATSGSCGDDEGSGGAGEARRDTGEPCTRNEQCVGALCLTDQTFADLMEGEQTAHIPEGYCSGLATCQRNTVDVENCGPDAYCYDLEPYVDTPITACLKPCESQADCRDGYVCNDASSSGSYPPFDPMACLPPDLLCLLEVTEFCADGGTGGSGGAGGATGGSGGATGGTGGTGGSGGATGGTGGGGGAGGGG